tara:strand:+ start:4985 stop:5905 length:921 start_codon:yes stop_codon:yes gene_type:complete
MKWDKLGLVYKVANSYWWAKTHAYIPTPVLLNNCIRVFISCWDEKQEGRIGYVDLDVKNPCKVLYISPEPVLDIGAPGNFDDSGVTPMSIKYEPISNHMELYYTGWQKSVKVPYTLFTGKVVSDNEQAFIRTSNLPWLDRTEEFPTIRTAAFVKDYNRTYYSAGKEWTMLNGKLTPTYSLYMQKITNIHPLVQGKFIDNILIFDPDRNKGEIGIGRPWSINNKMWYSIRYDNNKYKLGYAELVEEEKWQRMDNKVGITTSEYGWDSEMICFSAILPTKYGTYMFYNGNNFGQQGFGVAVLDENYSV